MSILFGPVPSRRFGKSLGIDLFTKKTCTFNCIYCEVGKNEQTVAQCSSTVDSSDVLSELELFLSDNLETPPDCITFAGSGEPLLHSHIDSIIEGIKSMTDIPVVLLTNGSMLKHVHIRKKILSCDVLVPSLDAAYEKTFQKINNPHSSFTLDSIISSLIVTRELFKGTFILEILIVKGVNDSTDEFIKFSEIVQQINPDHVQINTIFRPPAYGEFQPADQSSIDELSELLGDIAVPVKYFQSSRNANPFKGRLLESAVIKTLTVRPCSFNELSVSLSADRKALEKIVKTLIIKGVINKVVYNNEEFLEASVRNN